jgi:hypothetical protein
MIEKSIQRRYRIRRFRMAATAPSRRTPQSARRIGYLAAAAILAVMMFLLNVAPGWSVVPFLTAETDQVLLLVNASLGAGLVANLTYLLYDPVWVKALGEVITALISIVALARIWDVFPFDFRDYSYNWAWVARMAIAFVILGSVIAIVTNLIRLVRDRLA